MKTCVAVLKSATPYFQSRAIQSPRNTGEGADAHEERCWRERLHVDPDGFVIIPAGAIKTCLEDCAQFLSESVPGKGKATWTKHFRAGIMVIDPINTGVKASSVKAERLFLPASGRRGDGKRVWKMMPVVPAWQGEARVILLDPMLLSKPEKVNEYLGHAGKFIGLGAFRPRNGGNNGRFSVESFRVEDTV